MRRDAARIDADLSNVERNVELFRVDLRELQKQLRELLELQESINSWRANMLGGTLTLGPKPALARNNEAGNIDGRVTVHDNVAGTNSNAVLTAADLVFQDSSAQPTINLNGAQASLAVGGATQSATMVLRRAGNQECFSFDAGPGVQVIRDHTQAATVILNGQTASVVLGGTSQHGQLMLRRAGNQERFKVDSSTGELIGYDSANQPSINLNCESASFVVGGANGGTFEVRRSGHQPSITLDGEQGDIVLHNADCAEEFDLADGEAAEPGAVMVLDEGGRLRRSTRPYDRRVVGVIAGAGRYRPALVLDRQLGAPKRYAVSLLGKACCRVDARAQPVAVGDLLTTAELPGCAMKAIDPERAFGAVLGKALSPLAGGIGLIPVLVALQ